MNQPGDFKAAFERARNLHLEGRLKEAEQAYRQLSVPDEQRESVLSALAELYIHSQRPQEAVATLVALTRVVPGSMFYHVQLTSLLDGLGRTEDAIEHYRQLLQRQPGLAAAHFNLALLYKKNKRFADAVASYDEAVKLDIKNVQEVWSNMGVLYSEMRQAGKAAEMFERVLEVDPDYGPALFNRAGLFEEAGERQPAIELYRRILATDPGNAAALARLAYADKITDADDPLISSLNEAVDTAKEDQPAAREELSFALGKALDDVGKYDEAFAAYRAGNELGKLRNRPYDRDATEQAFDRLVEVFNAEWIKAAATASTASPVFICGMFRSGSTLVEQILAAHPSITPGGELDLLPWLLARRLGPYPDGAASASPAAMQQLGDEYLSKLQELFPGDGNITDKRPDNFLHLGLIKALFPAARIVYTKRAPLDNCLSVYFQQLGGNLDYATDLENIAHYYLQHERLMKHWSTCFADNIFTVDYDELVRAPEPVLRGLLDYLGLEWDQRSLDFQQAGNLVKTASVWQVREGLHADSSGRWRNYDAYVENIQATLKGA